MGRWIAIGEAPGWDDYERFKAETSGTAQWRVDAQTSITTVIALGDGRLLAECDAPKRERFEAWLAAKGWKVTSIVPVRYLARTGTSHKVN